MATAPSRKRFHWYSPDDTPAERKLLLKLDFLVVGYAFVVLWVKYIDQTNINNAYVSGLSDDLNFHGNQLVQFQTMFVVANVVGLLPPIYFFTKVPMYWLIPVLEFGWGVFTLLQFKANSYGQFMAYRFIVGLFEAPYYSAIHFVLGSWYRKDELARRGALFQSAIQLGILTAGLLQSAASKNLDGVNGLPGWRWNFIITSLFPLVLAPIGYFIWPGTPDKPNRRVMSESDLALARSRLTNAGTQIEPLPFSVPLVKKLLTQKKLYILVAWLTIVFNSSFANGAYLLWVKSLKRYSIPTINNLSTIQPAVAIFFILLFNFSADLFLGRTIAFLIIAALNFTILIIMAVYNVPEGAKWFALVLSGMVNSMIPLVYSWANTLLRANVKERSVTLILMQVVATSTNAWIPLLVWPTVESPRFRKGYPYAAIMTVFSVLIALSVRYIYRKEEAEAQNSSGETTPDLEDGEVAVVDKKSSTLDEEKIGGTDVKVNPI